MTQTITNATEDFLKSQIKTRDFRITQLEEHIQKVTQRSYADSADKNRMVEAMKEWTLGELENLSLAQEHAEAIAEIMGFELTTEFEVEVTVLYTITVNALNEEEAQNLIHDIDFDSVSEPQGVTYLSSSVDRIDIQQGATNRSEHIYKLLIQLPQNLGLGPM